LNKVAWFEWRCFSKDAAYFLRQIQPFLIAKAAQALVALKYAAFLETRVDPSAPISSVEAEFGLQCSQMIKALNSRRQNGYQLNRLNVAMS
jgi:hypothetical protein